MPGTICAYPLDILKIRMQTTNTGDYRSAMQFVMKGGSGGGAAGAAAPGLRGFYRGLAPAVELRIIARSSMFLFAELSSQLVEGCTPLRGASSRFVGSLGSGYATGFVAGLAEYRKKLLSQGVVQASQASYSSLLRSAFSAGQGCSLWRRLHGAGCRSAVNDSCFFSIQYYLVNDKGWSAPQSYAGAAAFGVVGAFLFDTAVARMMLVPPWEAVPGTMRSVGAVIWERAGVARQDPRQGLSLRDMFRGVRGGYRGLCARAGEFAISYGCTGVVGVWIASATFSLPAIHLAGATTTISASWQNTRHAAERLCEDGVMIVKGLATTSVEVEFT